MLKVFKDYQSRSKKYYSKHPRQLIVKEYILSLIAMVFSAFLYAFTFKVFLSPSVPGVLPLISGGTAGLARSVSVLFEMGGIHDTTLIYSIFYAVLNIPVIYLAFRYIGFRFGLFTAINVVATSLLTNYALNFDFIETLAKSIACYSVEAGQSGLLARAILAGVINGAASAIALGANGSGGGVDTVSYYFSLRKSNNIGHYTVIINTFIFILFASLNAGYQVMSGQADAVSAVSNMLLILLFITLFSFMSALVMDIISRQNKKEQIQIITKVENLSKLLLANMPHGATIVRSKGAFTGEDHIIIYVIVSTYETKAVVDLVREADPLSFIAITPIQQVYGRFVTRKVK